MLGSSVTGTLFYPDVVTVYSGPLGPLTVGAAVEFPQFSLAASGSLDVTDTQIIWNALASVAYGPGSFNGFRLVFSGVTLTSIGLNGSSTMTPVSFFLVSNNEAWFDLAGISATTGQQVILDVTSSAGPAATPEPYSVLLTATGMGALLLRRAAKRAVNRP
jgi:hypothetical protein